MSYDTKDSPKEEASKAEEDGGEGDGERHTRIGAEGRGGAGVHGQPAEAAGRARGRPPEHGGPERPRNLRAVLGDGAVPDL